MQQGQEPKGGGGAQKRTRNKRRGKKEYLQQKTEKFHLLSSPDAPIMDRQERRAEKNGRGEKIKHVKDLDILSCWIKCKV